MPGDNNAEAKAVVSVKLIDCQLPQPASASNITLFVQSGYLFKTKHITYPFSSNRKATRRVGVMHE